MNVNLSDIVVPENRYRREFDPKKMEELELSIARIGLLNPITIEVVDGKILLRAGERRYKTVQALAAKGTLVRHGALEIPLGKCPAVLFDELDELQRLEVEIEENSVRADFTWQERTRAFARLHELRKAQNPDQTIAATATEILGKPAVGDQRMVVSNALIVNKHLADPDVAKAKNEREALKIIEKKARAAQSARLSVTFDASKNPHKVIHGDSEVVLASIEAGSFDVILADPPYGIGADSFGDMSDQGHDYSDSAKTFEALCKWLPDELHRVAKKQAHCYLFCDERNFDRLATLMVLAGWKVFPSTLIWDKCGTGMLPFPDNGPRRTHERILYAWKGDRRTLVIKNDVIRVSAVRKLNHGAQKPVALYCDLLSRSANPGDMVLDCFGGSGPILVAANRLRLVATYIEREEAFYHIALSRMNEVGFEDGGEEDDGIEIAL